jgi:two-component system, LytTR family, response regulator
MRDDVLRVLIVDDEKWARRRVVSLLKDESGVEIVGEAGDGQEAVTGILELRPDLVFLDIQMDGMDGFDVIEAVGIDRMPIVVFATAFDNYAVRAFETHAVDYLLKPIDPDRLRESLDRARREIARDRSGPAEQLGALFDELRARSGFVKRIGVSSAGRTFIVRVADVAWFEAAGNYVKLHVGAREHLARQTMKELQSRLDPEQFVRVHRSAIVNLDRIRELQPWFRGEQVLILDDGTRVTIGRRYREELVRMLR